ncbi:MAG TPA: hypothetical protein VHW60_09510 [Caulobacteraceae bacterium]|jgi:hypothetical protein|nr:hypothetical protein [Caulobacteraceae bacterium]
MLKLRALHTYVGFFVAPSVLFFVLTGSLQLFSLHEAHGAYHPPALLETLGSVHTDQVLGSHHHHDDDAPPAAAAAPGAAHADADHDDDAPKLGTMLLKWFFLTVALCVAGSTCVGLWIGLSLPKRRTGALIALAAGAIIPVALLLI